MKIQAAGLTGHIDEFWPDLSSNSGWLGGTGESWERGPYYLDGLVPIAYLLDDPVLIAKARKWVNWTLEHQRPDGSIGPEKNKDWWPNMVMLKVLTQYQEATGDPRVIPVMEKYFEYQAKTLAENPLQKWAVYRWGDEVLSIVWLYRHNHDPKLLELATDLARQGYDWKRQFANFTYTGKMAKKDTSLETHVVNNAMALKTAAVYSLISNDESDRQAVYQMLSELDRYHLLPNGVHSGDEHYAGRDPSQGTELCAVVENMFSLETLVSILGDPVFGDRLEKIAYNPLPAALTSDMWAHQYDQQPNQVLVDVNPREWTTNNAESNLFGLEPNFGCCTANYHQGWPKFTESLWMANREGGLAAIAYAPSEVHTTVRGVKLSIAEETEYPFHETIKLTVNPETPVKFPMQLRIPRWTYGASIAVNGFKQRQINSASFYTISREWRKGDIVEIDFPMPLRASQWYRDSVALERGPLVFALKIGEKWKKLRDKGETADWEVDPKSAWNYGLAIDATDPARSVTISVRKMGDNPFTPDGTPIELQVKGRRIPDWKLLNGSAGPLPQSPVKSKQGLENLTLIPYGAAKLRITAFPVISK
ncbi:MAG: glycoside hydrolase family 127 protein [Acidobacteriota bacterium]|nr:glycoside hydrolase family 127 protein [Acidobacteriota bacterium]